MVAVTNLPTPITESNESRQESSVSRNMASLLPSSLYFLDTQDPARINGLSPVCTTMFLMKRYRCAPLGGLGTWQRPLISSLSLSLALLLFFLCFRDNFHLTSSWKGREDSCYHRSWLRVRNPWQRRQGGTAKSSPDQEEERTLDCKALCRSEQVLGSPLGHCSGN